MDKRVLLPKNIFILEERSMLQLNSHFLGTFNCTNAIPLQYYINTVYDYHADSLLFTLLPWKRYYC